MYTTLNKILEHPPCESRWAELLNNLGKPCADDEPLSILTVLDSNGLDDALWCLRSVEGHDKEIRLLAVHYAQPMRHLMTDPRSIRALDVAEMFANGQASAKELKGAAWAAWAARAAAWAARAARPAQAVRAADAAAQTAEANAAWAVQGVARAAWLAARLADAGAGKTVREAQAAELRRICTI